jgi:hypothetical protein
MMTAIDFLLKLITAGAGLGLLYVAYKQLTRISKQIRRESDQIKAEKDQISADFLYKIEQDILRWLERHAEAKKWIYSKKEDKEAAGPILKDKYDEWEFEDYLNYFETIWIFGKRNLIDIETFYDFYGYYFLSVYEANDKELERMIRAMREEEADKDLYEGVENLYNAMTVIKRRRV